VKLDTKLFSKYGGLAFTVTLTLRRVKFKPSETLNDIKCDPISATVVGLTVYYDIKSPVPVVEIVTVGNV
jgi:hypothetical protein